MLNNSRIDKDLKKSGDVSAATAKNYVFEEWQEPVKPAAGLACEELEESKEPAMAVAMKQKKSKRGNRRKKAKACDKDINPEYDFLNAVIEENKLD